MEEETRREVKEKLTGTRIVEHRCVEWVYVTEVFGGVIRVWGKMELEKY